jgi:pimeloyl-ACP methyl ester carboxylesterase
MSNDTSLTVPTRYIETERRRFAYRRWGKRGRPPVLFIQYFSASLDDWDPQVTDGLATEYDVIVLDNAGVASSAGETPARSRR